MSDCWSVAVLIVLWRYQCQVNNRQNCFSHFFFDMTRATYKAQSDSRSKTRGTSVINKYLLFRYFYPIKSRSVVPLLLRLPFDGDLIFILFTLLVVILANTFRSMSAFILTVPGKRVTLLAVQGID